MHEVEEQPAAAAEEENSYPTLQCVRTLRAFNPPPCRDQLPRRSLSKHAGA